MQVRVGQQGDSTCCSSDCALYFCWDRWKGISQDTEACPSSLSLSINFWLDHSARDLASYFSELIFANLVHIPKLGERKNHHRTCEKWKRMPTDFTDVTDVSYKHLQMACEFVLNMEMSMKFNRREWCQIYNIQFAKSPEMRNWWSFWCSVIIRKRSHLTSEVNFLLGYVRLDSFYFSVQSCCVETNRGNITGIQACPMPLRKV